MLRELNNKGSEGFASIVEVIVTAVIFVLATAGILTTVSMLKPHTGESSRKIEAAHIGKGIMDDLRREVDASTWDTGSLAIGSYGPFQKGDYSITYDISAGEPNLRYLTMDITWPDP